MNRVILIILTIACLVICAGCEKEKINETTGVETTSQNILDKIGYEPVFKDEETVSLDEPSSDVDVDLTTLSSTMIFAEVYNMMANPDEYIGKTIRITGQYYSYINEQTNGRHFFVIIKDATACCEQGMEFIWDEGSHTYPDEYPDEESEVDITGIFKTYERDGYNYCYLDIDGFE